MTNLVRAEFRKLFTTQVWFWLLLASLAITAISVIGQIASSQNFELRNDNWSLFTAANSAYIAVFVLGVLSITTEFRYQTITPTLLVTPSRWRLVGAKLITYTLVGILYALLCVVVQFAIALPWLSARNVHIDIGTALRAGLTAFAVVALFALVGLGAGALLKNQIVGVTVGLIFILVLSNVIVAIPGVKHIYPYLPTGATDAIVTQSSADRTRNGVELLPIWGGLLVLVVWGLGMAVLGAGLTMQRDVT